MISDTVATALISAFSGIVITYLTVYFRSKAVSLKNAGKPKDRMDLIFEGYEKLIKELQLDIDRKGKVITHFEELAEKYRKDIRASEDMIETLKDQIDTLEEEIIKLKKELNDAQQARNGLEEQLKQMKKDFGNETTVEVDTKA